MKSESAKSLAIFVAIFAIVMCLNLIRNNSPTPPLDPASRTEDQKKHDAFDAACNFIRRQYPGVKTIAKFDEAVLNRDALDVWTIAVKVDGVNSFNAPIRKIIGLSMSENSTGYHLVQMDQL